jgi:hypothetical protein
MAKTADNTAAEIKKWFSVIQTAKLNRNVDQMIAEMAPGLDQLAEAKVATFVYDFRKSNYSYFNSYFPIIFQTAASVIRKQGFRFMQTVTHPEDFLKCLYVTKQAVIEFSKMKDVEQLSSHFRLFFRICSQRREGVQSRSTPRSPSQIFDIIHNQYHHPPRRNRVPW